MRTHAQAEIGYVTFPIYFRTNGSDQLGIGVWSIKPTTKLKLFTSRDANLRPADSGKGIYRAYLPLLMCIEGQKVLHNIHISIAECQHIYVRCLDGSHITCRVNRKWGAYDQLRSEKTGIPPTLNLEVRGGNCDICYISGSLFICRECKQTLCAECNARVHQHPKRTHHKTNPLSECIQV